MLEVIENLLVLQDRDMRIRSLEEELERIPYERDALRNKTSSSQLALEQAKKRVMEAESERKRLELEVDGLKERITKYSQQQLQTKKNDEYRALDNEIGNCKKKITTLEDKQIEFMEAAEERQKEVKVASANADQARQAMESQVGDLDQREKNVEQELEQMESTREALAQKIDDITLRKYERLFEGKKGQVVVGIDHGVCGGCHMKLPAQVVVMVRAEQEVTVCPNCGRILYFTRDMNLATPD